MLEARRLFTAAMIAAALVAGSAGAASATDPVGATVTPVDRGTVGRTHQHDRDFKLFQKRTRDFVVVTFEIAPGGTLGWHKHPGPAFIKVDTGTLTIEHANCTFSRYPAGSAEVETMHQVHNAYNRGSTTVTGTAVYLNVPVGGATRTSVDPPRCAR